MLGARRRRGRRRVHRAAGGHPGDPDARTGAGGRPRRAPRRWPGDALRVHRRAHGVDREARLGAGGKVAQGRARTPSRRPGRGVDAGGDRRLQRPAADRLGRVAGVADRRRRRDGTGVPGGAAGDDGDRGNRPIPVRAHRRTGQPADDQRQHRPLAGADRAHAVDRVRRSCRLNRVHDDGRPGALGDRARHGDTCRRGRPRDARPVASSVAPR